eukprot:184920_1
MSRSSLFALIISIILKDTNTSFCVPTGVCVSQKESAVDTDRSEDYISSHRFECFEGEPRDVFYSSDSGNCATRNNEYGVPVTTGYAGAEVQCEGCENYVHFQLYQSGTKEDCSDYESYDEYLMPTTGGGLLSGDSCEYSAEEDSYIRISCTESQVEIGQYSRDTCASSTEVTSIKYTEGCNEGYKLRILYCESSAMFTPRLFVQMLVVFLCYFLL